MPKITIARFRTEVLDLYAPPIRSKNSWFKARQTLDILQAIGATTTADFTPALVARFIAHCSGRSEATIRGLLGYLSPVCKYAHQMGYARVNPFAIRSDWYRSPDVGDLDDPDLDRSKHVGLADLGKLLDHLERDKPTWRGGRLYALVATVAYTGMRRNEAITRATSDFLLSDRIVQVKARRRRVKTKASAQPVGLPPELVPILAEWLPRSGSPWAFPGVTGAAPWLGGAQGFRALDEIRAAGVACGIGPVNFLMLRHSWATHAEFRGLGELAVQRQLRHTSKRTQVHYRHADAANLAAAVHGFSIRPSAEVTEVV